MIFCPALAIVMWLDEGSEDAVALQAETQAAGSSSIVNW
jgi:hypothetical protein